MNLLVIRFKKIYAPFIIWMVVISTFIASLGGFSLLRRQIAGWAWVIPLAVSITIILRKESLITFPIRIWYPWICIIILYFVKSGFSYPQRTVMLLCPLIVGMAVSKSRVTELELSGFLRLTRMLLLALLLTVILKTGFLFTGILPGATGLSPQSMTAALLCCIFGAEYSVSRKKSLLHWIAGATIPIIALTRMAITAAGMTIPFTFASLKIRRRLIFLAIIAVVGVVLFYTERIQKKMFYSGRGDIRDVTFENPDLFTSGRSRLWDLMKEKIRMRPVWGHGGNASEEFVLSMTWNTLTHPHNDWLRLLYDYGLVGTSVFVFCLITQVIHLLIRAKNTLGESRILLYAGASSFLPFVLLMFTENIILYAAFFGDLQFTIIGLVYAAQRTQEIDAWQKRGQAPFSYQAPFSNRSRKQKSERNYRNGFSRDR